MFALLLAIASWRVMSELALALVWHHHQPYYPDDVGGENPMPWVRLHGVKDYYGMALHLREVPEFHCTVNLVPSLVVQLEAYRRGQIHDTDFDLSRRSADDLSEADCLYLMDHFFMAHVEHMIRPYDRYYELYRRRNATVDTAKRALRRFRPADLRDLQVWWNLTWVHPLAIEQDPELAQLVQKGRGFTESDKDFLLDRHLELLGRIVPAYRALADDGQVELTTTPFYHPIVPLLWDKRLAREAMPNVDLPRFLNAYPEDAQLQIHRAAAFHRDVFGRAPQGMWPAEGSVCPQMIPTLAEAGIQWIGTDEEILVQSTDGRFARDAHAQLHHPELLYRPWRALADDDAVTVLFRDHVLSDLIGFHYQRTPAPRAVDDFIDRLDAIAAATRVNNGSRPAVVPVILDGENCWEFYPGGGVEFLRTFYRRCADHRGLRPVTVSEHLAQWPSAEPLPRLASGSWIHHDFAIWIGDEQNNRAWDLIHQTREHLRQAETAHRLDERQAERAWEEIYIAEGSDWFWWFGPSHTSAQEETFDRLFRTHLANVYLILGDAPPPELQQPICRDRRVRAYTDAKGFLDVEIDGRRTFFEWINAAHYTAKAERGAMVQASAPLISDVYFGFSRTSLLLRVDCDGPAREHLRQCDTLRVVFLEPEACELVVTLPSLAEPVAQLYRGTQALQTENLRVATDRITELEIPLEALGTREGNAIDFFVELLLQERSVDRAPREGIFETVVPSANYEQIMWQA
jgi:alpha-amylase/alpha-mannosidase (GH57 family)